jgi:peptidoglycan/LPS O-acetylase OafA/YrhL
MFGAFEAIFGFLLISGLSIGKSIAKNKESYFKRRANRIYPVYIASILFQWAVIQPTSVDLLFIGVLLLNVLFLNQILTNISFVEPAWTLAVEVWLYCLAPWFLKLSFKQVFVIIYTSVICYVAFTCGRTLFNWNYYSGIGYGLNILFLAFVWVIGFALAVFPEKRRFIILNIALIFILHIGLSASIQAAYRYKHNEVSMFIGSDLIGFAFKSLCLLMVYLVVVYNHRFPTFTTFTKKTFTLLGNISYPLYLTHITSFVLLKKWNISNSTGMIVFSLGVSYIIYILFDSYSKKREVKGISKPFSDKILEYTGN